MSGLPFEPLLVRSAGLLLERLGIEEPEEIDVEAVAQACGATVVYEPLQGCEARIVGVRGRAVITVDQDASRARQRFSVAHELGHWMHDRGRVAFACAEGQFVGEWGQANPERRANRFAADLLLPRTMFKRRARGRPLTLATVRELASEFQTSLTATAIRLIDLAAYPALVTCHDGSRRRWLVTSAHLPEHLVVPDSPRRETPTAMALRGIRSATGKAVEVPAAHWTAGLDLLPSAGRHDVLEDCVMLGQGLALTMVWWRDETPIIALADRLCPKLH